jgi:hypothetical protein
MIDLTAPDPWPASQRILFGDLLPTAETLRPPSNGTFTSDFAAESIAATAPLQRGRVLRFITDRGEHGATADEASRALDLPLQSATPRLWELRRMGMIRRSGAKRPTQSGRPAYVYIATGEGGRS